MGFPFLLGGTFIEATNSTTNRPKPTTFPSFWEGLSLRPDDLADKFLLFLISLPFGKGFH